MKNLKVYMLALVFTGGMGLTSCEAIKNTNNTQRGVAIGATSGAVIGGVRWQHSSWRYIRWCCGWRRWWRYWQQNGQAGSKN